MDWVLDDSPPPTPRDEERTNELTNDTHARTQNMVGPGEVDDELHSETREECEKHGPVADCVIFEVQGAALPEAERVRIFVAFAKQESAVKAYVAMNGRFFGGRQVQASFFDEERFAKRDLAPRPGE